MSLISLAATLFTYDSAFSPITINAISISAIPTNMPTKTFVIAMTILSITAAIMKIKRFEQKSPEIFLKLMIFLILTFFQACAIYASKSSINPNIIKDTSVDINMLAFHNVSSHRQPATKVALSNESINEMRKYFQSARLAISLLTIHLVKK